MRVSIQFIHLVRMLVLCLLSFHSAEAKNATIANCSSELSQLHLLIDRYMDAAKFGAWAPKTYGFAHRELQNFVSGVSVGCEKAVAERYAITMFQLVTEFKSTQTYKPELLQLLENLRENGRFIPLTAQLRKSYAIESKDSEWLTLLGAYDCKSTTIYFDLSLPPLDLGATIAHELDHLMRDKLSFGAKWASSIRDSTPEEIVVIDETLATIMTAMTEFRFFTDHNRDQASDRKHRFQLDSNGQFKFDAEANQKYPNDSVIKTFGEFFGNKYTRYNVPNHMDLDLASKRGPIYQIWWKNFRNGSDLGSKGIPIFGSFSDLYLELERQESLPELQRVLREVAKVYFPDNAISVNKLSVNIQSWIRQDSANASINSLRNALSERNLTHVMEMTELNLLLKQAIIPPTQGCIAIAERAHSVQAEHEGVRPEHEGVRPEHEGVRPEHEGVRPEHEGVRPCLRLEKGI